MASARHWAYDPVGRVTARRLCNGCRASLSYDAPGAPAPCIEANGSAVTFSYDGARRPTGNMRTAPASQSSM
jgi:YD repeat-containing protein